MIDTYRGETPVKSVNRFLYWYKTMTEVGESKFCSGKFLVLVSREAGDISCLLGLGVPISNIVGVEINPEAAEKARKRYPEAEIITGDVAEIVKKRQRRRVFDFAYLDLCGCVGEQIIDTCRTVIQWGMKSTACIGWTVQVGREKDLNKLNKIKRWSRKHTELLTGQTPTTSPSEQRFHNAKARVVWVIGEIMKQIGFSYLLVPQFCCCYHSGKTPLVTIQYQMERSLVATSEDKYIRRYVNKKRSISLEAYTLWNIANNNLRRMVLHALSTNGWNTDQVAQIFNLKPSTVSAWKAHESRGTYEPFRKDDNSAGVVEINKTALDLGVLDL